jgi:hypothetical protein
MDELPEWLGDFHGARLRAAFAGRLREERAFPSIGNITRLLIYMVYFINYSKLLNILPMTRGTLSGN